MLKTLTDFSIALLDLLEAEAKTCQRGIIRVGAAFVIGISASIVIIGAVGLLMRAFYLILAGLLGTPGALFSCAIIMLIIAGGALCYAHRMLR